MVTPRVDFEHDVFGFTHSWIDKISERIDQLFVITFKIGKTNLNDNVKLYSAQSKTQVGKLIKLNTLLWTLIPKVDVVFTHMYPWLPIAAAPYVKVFRKPLVAWNAHGTINLYKRILLGLVDKVVTSSDRGFNIKTPKKVIINQGIDTMKFSPASKKRSDYKFKIISAGRVGRAKGFDVLIRAVDILIHDKKKHVEMRIIGPIQDRKFFSELKTLIESRNIIGNIIFSGSVPFEKMEEFYMQSDLYASASTTGSLDKTTLEAMSSGIPVVVCNEAFLDIFDDEMKEKCYFRRGDYRELSGKIEHFMNQDEEELRKRLRNVVMESHSVDSLADKLCFVFNRVKK
jgi:glycosyltransferase involved in cell wall biosynthesis